MSHYKPYPAYKDSGVEWLGRVPEHWSIVPLKWCFECLDGKRVPLNSEQRADIKGEVPYWGSGGVVDHIEKFIFDEPLVLLGEDGAPFFDRDRPVAYAIKGKSWINNHIHVLRPLTDYPITWFVHALNCVEYRHYIDGSTRDKLTQDDMKSISLAIPESSDEARKAVAHLDRETARIDALIEKKTRFIELLLEKRQALITHAVTKGLDPKARMKDSGVEWLGEVPEHWKLVPLKYVTPSLTVGIVVNPSDYVADEGLPFLYGGDIGEGVIFAETARRISPEHSQRNAKTRLNAGDLVTVRVGAPGVTAVVPPECEGGNCASVMLIRRGAFNSDWLCYTMNSRVVRYQVEVVQYGAAQEQFNISHAVDFLIPVPPLEEQAAIASALNQEGRRVDALLSKTERSIALLKERRSALITAAVTGQIDLREAV
ncbi:restriction endonuclease subunit S [Stutzerimonas kunmingensis]|uniref:restriction endonuclease subunit S n=1 Tax=Stutzerimonas kunmingensis TaxID=1211807 RepID=UPI0028AC3A99|nr:restriction endonuclease subunit S [Stutzerimonas kunmingensis]